MFSSIQVQGRTWQPCWIFILILLLAWPARFLGQAYFGSVTGLLTDPTGAVLPEAKVILTDQNKGYTFNEVSDHSGRYLFRSIPPGVYSVTAEVPGFEKTVRTGIRVDVNQNVTANMNLKISSSSQTVEVKSQTQGLDAQDATTGLVIDRKFINDLPLIDRLRDGPDVADAGCYRDRRSMLRWLHGHQLCFQREQELYV